ncbi:MAG TPA: kelch repeat-containing protein [Myxococcales bacterium]|nr:kelch repeat-containing protein [Myxococcales bacterium]
MSGRLAAVLAAAVGLAACGPRETVYQLKLITTSCDAPSPLENVTHFLFRITGEGIADPIEVTTLATARQVTLPPIPVGPKRVVEVRAFQGEPRGGVLWSVGRTLAFEVPSVPLAVSQDLTVFLRPKNSLLPVSLSISPQSCARMGYPRAGHTATVLASGRVLVAGGFTLNAVTGERVASARAELFDPSTGGFADLPDLSYPDAQQRPVSSPRAFHTATSLGDGQVLLAGGEVYVAGDPTPRPLAEALLFDPIGRSYRLVTMNLARSEHGAAADSGGRVLLLGGITTGGALAETLEWFDPARTLFVDVPLAQLGRVQMGVSPVQDGKFIAVAGGSTGTAVTTEVRLYTFNTSGTYSLATTSQLIEPRRAPALTTVGDPSRLVAVGGYSNLNELTGVSPLASSEVIATQPQVFVTSGPNVTARGDACVASLRDGRVLVAGGRSVDFNFAARSDESVELMVPPSTGGPPAVLGLPSFARGRYGHTCTPLPDGTVLIAGGVYKQDPDPPEVLQDAFIFTPAPLD